MCFTRLKCTTSTELLQCSTNYAASEGCKKPRTPLGLPYHARSHISALGVTKAEAGGRSRGRNHLSSLGEVIRHPVIRENPAGSGSGRAGAEPEVGEQVITSVSKYISRNTNVYRAVVQYRVCSLYTRDTI